MNLPKYLAPEGSAPKPPTQDVEREEPREATEDPDTLRSRSFAAAVDLLCEGPIEGACNEAGEPITLASLFGQSVYLDEIAVQNENGAFNFKGVDLRYVYGTQAQAALPGFGKAEETIFRGVEFKKGNNGFLNAAITAITNPDAASIEVAVRFPSLLEQDPKTGDIHGSHAEWLVQYSLNGGPWTFFKKKNGTDRDKEIVSGKSTTSYINVQLYRLPHSETPENDSWLIRLVRTWPDAPDLKTSNQTFLEYITVITSNEFRYPNSVLCGVEIDAKGFSSVPQRAFHIKGLRIKVPNNYFPRTGRRRKATYNRDPITGDQIVDGVLTFTTVAKKNKTVTVGGYVYTFKETLAAAGDVMVGATAAESALRLRNAIMHDGATAGIHYHAGTPVNAVVTGSVVGAVLTVAPIIPGATLIANETLGGGGYWGAVDTVWNGGFYTAWSDNPAWCMYDLLTNKRYGLGDYMPTERVDKWSLYLAGKYCDDMVADGFGNIEPRFACNVYIQAREESWKVIQDFASIFRAMAYWANGSVMISQDRPTEPVATFTNANVFDGVFNYAGTAKKARHTTVAVRWSDPEDFFKPKVEYVDDPDGIARYGINHLDIAAFACTSRGQANRLGRWLLRSELDLTDTVSFKTGLEGAYLRPGDVLDILDNDRQGVQQGGRVTGIDANRLAITLDREVVVPAGVNTITLARGRANLDPDEITSSANAPDVRTQQLQTFTITNAADTTDRITFAAALPAEISLATVWVLQTTAIVAQQFRIFQIEELEAGRAYGVSALQYKATKFTAVDTGVPLDDEEITDQFSAASNPVSVIRIVLTRQAVFRPAGGIELFIEASWEQPPDELIDRYIIEMRRTIPDEQWRQVGEVTGLSFRIPYTQPGTYEVAVSAVNVFGVRAFKEFKTIVIDDASPFDLYSITGLELTGQGNDTEFIGRDARFEWRLNSPANSQNLGSDTITSGQDPLFKDYVIRILDAATADELYRETVLNPFFVFSYAKNSECDAGPRNTFTIEVRGRDRFNNLTDPALLTVINPAPPPPTNLVATSSFKMAFLSWDAPVVFDLDAQLIYESAGINDFDNASLVATVGPTTTSFSVAGLTTGTTYYYWIKAQDTFGSTSGRHPAGAGVSTVPGQVETTDLDDFAVDVTKLFQNTIALQSDNWTNNSPAAGRVAWNAHNIVFRGVVTAITASDTPTTNDRYVWWRGPIYNSAGTVIVTPAETVYRTATSHPKDAALMLQNDFIIATNTGGAVDLAWRAIANALIGSASIRDLAVTSAKIQSLAADKITAGIIEAQAITIKGATGLIKSDTFVTGSAGWQIKGDGTAEFSELTARGTFAAGKILTDTTYATSAYPTRFLHAAAIHFLWNDSVNFDWGGATNLELSIDGAASVTKAVEIYESGIFFYGKGYPVSSGFVDKHRLLEDEPVFVFSLRFNQSGSGGKVSIIYRKGTNADTLPLANDDPSRPWQLAATDQPTIVGIDHSATFGTITNLDIGDDEYIQFAVAPIGANGNSSATTDVLDDIRLVIQVQNF